MLNVNDTLETNMFDVITLDGTLKYDAPLTLMLNHNT